MSKFYVLEPHVAGTTTYSPGDEREAEETDVAHLVELKVLTGEKPKGWKAKAEGAAAQNKAEGGADANKDGQ